VKGAYQGLWWRILFTVGALWGGPFVIFWLWGEK
jgi:hypothetical protein